MSDQARIPQLFDAATGAPASLAAEEIPKAIASGKYSFLKGDSIPVLSPDGKPGVIPAEDAHLAFGQGYQLEPISSQQERLEAKTYGAPGQQAIAGLEGAARGVTLGLSDPLLTSLGDDPEAMKARRKANPGTAITTEIGGAVLPALLTGGGSAAAEGAAGAASLIPSVAAGRVGAAVTGAVSRAIGSEGAKSLAARIATGALSAGAGSAVEGALYGAGATISETALGDHDQVAEKLMSNVGLGALVGGISGGVIGGLLGIKAPAAGKEGEAAVAAAPSAPGEMPPTPMQALTPEEELARYGTPPAEPGSLKAHLSTLDPQQSESVLEGLTKLKPNADEIVEAGKLLDAPVLESQVSASKHVQDFDSMLMQNPTTTGVARGQLLQKGFDQVESKVGEALGHGVDLSLAETGEQVKKLLISKLDGETAPINEAYRIVEEELGAIPVSERAVQAVGRNIAKLEEVRIAPSSPQAAFARRVADELPNLKSAHELRRYSSILRQSVSPTAEPGVKHMVGVIREKIDDLIESSTRRAAATMKTPQAKERVLGFLAQAEQAKASYAEFAESWREVLSGMGKGQRFKGAQAFRDVVENMTSEQIAKKLTAKDNSRLLSFMAKEHPEVSQLLMNYQRAAIREAAMKDGQLQIGKVLAHVDKLSPEMQKSMFSDRERQIFQAAKTWYESLPKNINPSGTSKAEAYRRYFENPIKAFGQEIYDKAGLAGMQRMVQRTAGSEAPRVQALIRLERMAQDTSQAIRSSVKSFMASGKPAMLAHAAAPASAQYLTRNRLDSEKSDRRQKDRYEFYKERYAEVTKAVADPMGLSSNVGRNLASLSSVAPNVASSLSAQAVKAAQFLYSKAPQDPLAGKGMMPNLRKWVPSDAEIARWERYVTAVDHPMSVLKDMKHGMLTRESVEALREVYPKLHGEIVQHLTEHLSDLKDELPYQKRLQLAVFFGVPVDATTDPAFVSQMQQIHAQSGGGQQQGQAPQPSGAAPNLAQSKMTDTQRVLTRG